MPQTDPTPARRRYDSPARRQQAVANRERIVIAGAELVRGFPTWDWSGLTFRAVAEAVGVSEWTAYRNFPTERHLHDAVMNRLEEDAGINYEDVDLDNLTDVTAQVFASLHRFAIQDSVRTSDEPIFASVDARRRQALVRAISAKAPKWSDTQHRTAAGLLDLLWTPLAYERLVHVWKLDDADATDAVRWLMGTIIQAIEDDAPLIRRGSVERS